jgi:hypothetical protein
MPLMPKSGELDLYFDWCRTQIESLHHIISSQFKSSMKYLFSIVFCVGLALQGYSQSFNIKGVVIVEGKQEALPFVNVLF